MLLTLALLLSCNQQIEFPERCYRVEWCGDGIDADCDGLVDCEDGECAYDEACYELDCTDGVDGDGDGLVDCEDEDCWGPVCNDWVATLHGGTATLAGAGTGEGSFDGSWLKWAFVGEARDMSGSLAVWDPTLHSWTRCGWNVGHASSTWLTSPSSGTGPLRSEVAIEPPCRPFAGEFLPAALHSGRATGWYGGEVEDFESSSVTRTNGAGSAKRKVDLTLRPTMPRGRCSDGDPILWHPDTDGDGYGDATQAAATCGEPWSDWIPVGGDCDDQDAELNPAAEERCLDAVDDDCDGARYCTLDHPDLVLSGDGDGSNVGSGLTIADIDGDGADELLVRRIDDAETASVYRFDAPLEGSLDFADATARLPGGLGFGYHLSTGDVTGDGALDVLLTDAGNTVYLLPGPMEGLDEPSVRLWEHAWYRPPQQAFAIRDIDGDGVDDVLLNWPLGVEVVEGGPQPGFAPDDIHSTISAYDAGGGSSDSISGGADLDGDGLGDLVVGSERGEHVGIFYAPLPEHASTIEGDARITRAGFPGGYGVSGFGSRVESPGDLDGDGYAELWLNDRDMTPTTSSDWHTVRDGTLYLFSGPIFGDHDETAAVASVDAWEPQQGLGLSFTMGDFDGDGQQDLAVTDASSTFVVFGPFAGRMDLRDAAWRITETGGVPAEAYAMATGDLDGDGLDDLAISSPYAEVEGDPAANDRLRIFLGASLSSP